ncbi:hypothetical protein [Salinispora tropica]|uniref:hypothetical protein n=1 Tax=Salinispora tropica TaxID=168695 RepID=UPI0009B7EC28|nr:hypothetical protein [Salinispora tropica]
MRYQDQTQGPVRPGGSRARWRWWAVGLAGVTGLALGAVGVAASPAVGAFGRTLTAADDHGGDRGRHDDTNKRDAGKGDDRGKGDGKGRGSQKPAGIPVPCDADALIAQITLANARGGAVLDLAKDCTYLLTADIDGAGLPAITAPITLNGGKKTTIERAAAVDEFRIFTVDVGGDLTLNKLTVTGGQTDGDGGGILVNAGGALTTTHSTITRNISGDSGGGIANNGTTRVNHSTVNRNTANDTNEQGGGIYSTGLLEIVKSHIDNNLSEFGGGIYSSSSTVTVKGGTISGNQAAIGGGLYVSGGIGVVTGTRIAGNSAADTGGVRVSTVGQVTLRKVALTGNTAQTVGGLGVSGPTNGGASFAVVEDSVIKNNIATEFDGGGIFNGGQTVVRNTKIIDNQADRGGGIFNSTQATTSLFSTKVIKNIAVTNGGGIFNAAGTVDLNTATGTVVIKNRPNNCVNVPGCAG